MTLAPSQTTTTTTMPRPSDVTHMFAPKRPSIAEEWALRQTAQPVEPEEDFECCKQQCPVCLGYDEEFDVYFSHYSHWCEDEYDGAIIADIRCDEHGNMFNPFREEEQERDQRLFDEFLRTSCDYRCELRADLRCHKHSHLFDKWLYVDDDPHSECNDNRYSYYEIESNPEAVEHDFVETHWKLTSRDLELDRHGDQYYRAGRRRAINSSPRITRRDGSVKQRDRYDGERYDESYLKLKYAVV